MFDFGIRSAKELSITYDVWLLILSGAPYHRSVGLVGMYHAGERHPHWLVENETFKPLP